MTNQIPIYVLTNDNHRWLLPGFGYLFNHFWPGAPAVTVAGYHAPETELPANFAFLSLGKVNLPAERWTDGLMALCRRAPDHFILLLEDFWLTAPPVLRVIFLMEEYLRALESQGRRVLRLDLSGDRAATRDNPKVDSYAGCGVLESGPAAPYLMSFQAAIWNRDLLLAHLQAGESPWQAEIEGSKRLAALGERRPRVLGVAEAALHYQAVYRSRRDTLSLERIPGPERRVIERSGWDRRGKRS